VSVGSSSLVLVGLGFLVVEVEFAKVVLFVPVGVFPDELVVVGAVVVVVFEPFLLDEPP